MAKRSSLACVCLLSLPVLLYGGPIRTTDTPAPTDGSRDGQTPPFSDKEDQTLPLVRLSPATHTTTTTSNSGVKLNQSIPKSTTIDQPLVRENQLSTTLYQEITDSIEKQSQVSTGVDISAVQVCENYTQCYPSDLSSIPNDLVYCNRTSNTCVCNDCFVLVNNTCAVERCHRYDNDSGCVDERKSQKALLLLSVFLSSTGAANLYIGQEALGWAQFGLLLLTFTFCCCIYCTKRCFIDCCKCFEDECECYDCCEDFWMCCHELCASLCIIFSALGTFLCCVAIAAWWAADISSFVENKKLDSDGCPLKYDL